MGSLLGSKFAILFLLYYERKWLGDYLLQFKHKIYCHYVDDIFLTFDRKDHVKKLLQKAEKISI